LISISASCHHGQGGRGIPHTRTPSSRQPSFARPIANRAQSSTAVEPPLRRRPKGFGLHSPHRQEEEGRPTPAPLPPTASFARPQTHAGSPMAVGRKRAWPRDRRGARVVPQGSGRWPRDALRAWPRDRPFAAAARSRLQGVASARAPLRLRSKNRLLLNLLTPLNVLYQQFIRAGRAE